MHKMFEISQLKVKGGCQLGRKVVHHDSKSDLPLILKFLVYRSMHLENIKRAYGGL